MNSLDFKTERAAAHLGLGCTATMDKTQALWNHINCTPYVLPKSVHQAYEFHVMFFTSRISPFVFFSHMKN